MLNVISELRLSEFVLVTDTSDYTQHTSASAMNVCGFTKINTFFQSGILPGKDNFCSLEAGPFNVTDPGGLEKSNDWSRIQDGMRGLLHR